MSNANKSSKKDNFYVFIVLAFAAGFLCGAAFAVYKMPSGSKMPPGSQTTTESQQSSNISDQELQAIVNLEAEVTANPEKFQAWTQLGNLYYDSDQPLKAIKAYSTSLQLHAGNANILTDLGVMYRRAKQPQKALESFEKAIAMDPTHEVSRLNKGIVLMYDLDDIPGAINAWEGLLTINPDAKAGNGDPIKDFIDHLKQDQAKQGQ
jgi:cytochrome c-type biogenesis protein CcmH/NrfG